VLCFVWAWCVTLSDMCNCVLFLIILVVVPLPSGKNPFAVQLNNNKRILPKQNYVIKYFSSINVVLTCYEMS
jgi:hypothetical protein